MGWQSEATPPKGSTSQPGSKVVAQPATVSMAVTSSTCPASAASSSSSALRFIGFIPLIPLLSSVRYVA